MAVRFKENRPVFGDAITKELDFHFPKWFLNPSSLFVPSSNEPGASTKTANWLWDHFTPTASCLQGLYQTCLGKIFAYLSSPLNLSWSRKLTYFGPTVSANWILNSLNYRLQTERASSSEVLFPIYSLLSDKPSWISALLLSDRVFYDLSKHFKKLPTVLQPYNKGH